MFARFHCNLEPPAVYLVMGIPTAWFSFQKLDGHKQMLDQMKSFDLRNAQCALETDRVVLQRLVQDLFDEALEPPVSVSLDAGEVSEADTDSLDPLVLKQSLQDVRHVTSYPTEEEVIGQFNAYVRGPLRDRVMSLIGREIDIWYPICRSYSWEFSWFSAVIVTQIALVPSFKATPRCLTISSLLLW